MCRTSTTVDRHIAARDRSVTVCRVPDNGTLPRVIPWIIIAMVAVPLVVVAFVAMRRNAAESERPASDDAAARMEREFADAEAYEAKWHEDDKERFHQERLP
jgi:hypothetical protein